MAPPLPFFEPQSLDEALDHLSQYGEDAKVVAGGTALTIMLQQGLIAPAALVGLGCISGLDGIVADSDQLRVGALATHRDVELSPVVRSRLPALSSAFGCVGNVRVRNAGTVGGILAEADYASDPPALLNALDATVVIAGPGGEREEPAATFLVGFYETTLEPTELVVELKVPYLPAATGCAYVRHQTRSEDRPCVGVAAVVGLEEDAETVSDLRVSVGAAAEVPQRFKDVESRAQGNALNDRLIGEIAAAYADSIETLSDARGSAWYRREMVQVFIARAIRTASRPAA